MHKRFLTATALIIITVGGVLFYPVCGIISTLLIAVGLWEFFNLVETKGVRLFRIFGLLVGLFIPISIYFRFPVKEGWQLLFVVLGLFLLFLLELTKKERYQPIFSISATVFGILYISWCFSFIVRIRQLSDGMALMGFLLLVTKSSDIGAYFLGKRYGKVPLIKRVSPQKSFEGAIGGFLLSLVVGTIFSFLVQDLLFFGEKLFLAAVLALIAQLGDLFESLIKRDCNIKDSGTILPGMGGVLDVIDSLIFTAPTFYLYITLLR
jgi:phosphatidate cytidylyltransferase